MKIKSKNAWLTFATVIGLVSFNVPVSMVYARSLDHHTTIQTTKDTREVLYKDFLILQLSPTIHAAVNKYYGSTRRIALREIRVLSIKRLTPGSYKFEITLLVPTSKGSFNPPYGIEKMTITNVPDLRVIKYEHQDA